MIADATQPHCIAGVFGGKDSGIDEETTTVFIESAYFHPVSIRKTAKFHGLNTDASFRFERGIDPEIGIMALKRAAILIKQLAGGEVSSEIQEFTKPLGEAVQIFLSFEKIEKTIGQPLEKEELNNILNGLDISIVNVSESGIGMTIPRYRVDVTRPADVIEEILRVYGYNRLIEKPLVFEANPSYQWNTIHKIEQHIANKLSGLGFLETLNNSLSSPDYSVDFHEAVTLVNPLGKELSKLRQTLIYQALEVVSFNLNRQNKRLKLYEFGSIYGKLEDEFIEEKHLSITLSGDIYNEHWETNSQPDPFFYFKGIFVELLNSLGYTKLNFTETESSYFETAFSIVANNNQLGVFGIVSSTLKNKFGIDQDVYLAELNWELLTKNAFSKSIKYNEVAKFPQMRRDFALLVDKEVRFESLEEIAFKTERKILQKVNLFDVYEGKNLPKGKKSYGISFTFQDKSKTLTDKQVEKIMEKLLKNFKETFNAELR